MTERAALNSYADLIAEAKRVSDMPRWVHLASLGKMATYFGKSLTDFHVDAGLTIERQTLYTYVRALEIYDKVPKAVRHANPRLSYYSTALNLPEYKAGKLTPREAFDKATKQMKAHRVGVYFAAFGAALNAIESGKVNLTSERAAQLVAICRRLEAVLKPYVRAKKSSRAA